MKRVLLLVIFLLSLQLAAGLDVEFYIGNEPVNVIGTGMSIPVVMQVSIDSTEENLTVVGDISELNADPITNFQYKNFELTCTPIIDNETNLTTNYECFNQIILLLRSSEANLTFQINESTQENFTAIFTIDDTSPQVSSITTNFKVGDDYFVKSEKLNKLDIALTDSVGTFNFRNIHFLPDGGFRSRVVNCTSTNCYGNFPITCTSRQQVKVSLVTPSTDDAGNELQGVTQALFTCDELEPKATAEYLTYDNSTYPEPKSGDTVTFSVIVEEDTSGVIGYANTTNMTGATGLTQATCTKLSDTGIEYNCSWTLSNILAGENKIEYYFVDGVGRNSSMYEYTRHVDLFVSASNQSTPLFFRPVQSTLSASDGYNRVALDLAMQNAIDYPIFSEFRIQRSNIGAGNIEVLHTYVEPYDCFVPYDNITISAATFFKEIKIANPVQDSSKEYRLDFVLNPGDVNDLDDEFDVVCNVSSLVRESGIKIYEEPTHFAVTTTIKLRNSRIGDELPGMAYVEKIKSQEKKVEILDKSIGLMDKIMATMADICNIDKTLGAVGGVGAVVKVAGATISAFNSGTGDRIIDYGDKAQSYTRKNVDVNDRKIAMGNTDQNGGILGNLNLGNILNNMCRWTTCSLHDSKNSALKEDIESKSLYGGNTPINEVFAGTPEDNYFQDVANGYGRELVENVNVPNPRNSIIAAIRMKCFPAVVYHLNTYRVSECNVLSCMKQQSAYALDIGVCMEARGQYICRKLIDEAFEMLGPLRQTQNLVDNANGIVQTIIPTTLKVVLANPICQEYLYDGDADQADLTKGGKVKFGKKALIFLCDLPDAIGTQLNYQVKTTSSADSFQYPSGDDVCSIALCKEENFEDCVKSSSWLGQILPINIPGGSIEFHPNVDEFTVDEIDYYLDQYQNGNDQERTEAKEKLENVPIIDANQLDSNTYVETIRQELRDYQRMGDSDSIVLRDPNGDLYIPSVDWQSYYTANERLITAEASNNLRPGAWNDRPELIDYTTALNEYNSALNRYESTTLPALQNELDTYQFLYERPLNTELDRIRYQSEMDRINREINEEKPTEDDFNINELENQAKNKYPDSVTSINNADAERTAAQDQQSRAREQVGRQFSTQYTNLQDQITTSCAGDGAGSNACIQAQANMKELTDQMDRLGINPDEEGFDPNNPESFIPNDEKTQTYVLEQQRIQETQLVRNQISQISNAAVSFAISQGWLDWAVSTNYGSETFLGQTAQFSETWLNVDNYKQGICSPLTTGPTTDVGQMGTALQCREGLCRPVLTLAAERIEFNDTHYIYSIVYSLGPVDGASATQDTIKYNVFLNEASGMNEYKLFNNTWMEMEYYTPVNYATAVIGKREYGEICIKFEEKYPPLEISARRDFCRDIIISEGGQSAFDTGAPTPADYLDPETIAPSSTNPDNAGFGDI